MSAFPALRVAVRQRPVKFKVWKQATQSPRFVSTSSPSQTSSRFAPFAAGLAIASAAAYLWSSGSKNTSETQPATPACLYPQPVKRHDFQKDFTQAIKELKGIFPADQVTTEEDELVLHGVSPNTHHSPSYFTLQEQNAYGSKWQKRQILWSCFILLAQKTSRKPSRSAQSIACP